jgi:hypothetical protein
MLIGLEGMSYTATVAILNIPTGTVARGYLAVARLRMRILA